MNYGFIKTAAAVPCVRVGDIAFASNRFDHYMDYVEATLKSLGELVE